MVTVNISDFSSKSRKVVVRSIIEAVRETLREFLPTIAKDTGALRHGFRTGILNQISGLETKKSVDIEFNMNRLSHLDYAKYHIVGSDLNPNFRGGYKNPITPGTKPIDPREFNLLLKQNIGRILKRRIQEDEKEKVRKVKKKPTKKKIIVKKAEKKKEEIKVKEEGPDQVYNRFLAAFDAVNIRERRGNIVPIPKIVKEMGVSISFLRPLLLKWEKERAIHLSIAHDQKLLTKKEKENSIGFLDPKDVTFRGFIHFIQVLKRTL